MTRKQRAQVIELLRCAADQRVDGIGLNGMFDATTWLGTGVHHLAWCALIDVQDESSYRGPRDVVGLVDEHYRYELLEAAQRVEEGSWPCR